MVSALRLLFFTQACLAAPGLIGELLKTVGEITNNALQVVSVSGLMAFIDSIPLGPPPENQEDAVEAISKALNQSGGNPIAFAGLMKSAGVFPEESDYLSLSDIVQRISGCRGPCSDNNNNTREPEESAYEYIDGDAPWSLSEEDLRKAIYFPPTYTWGEVTPLIMVPGTGGYGSQVYDANFGIKLEGSGIADPVYLNIPEYLLDDVQKNGEYVAYAMKYISAVSKGRSVGAITLSQGSIDVAWALQYWPSARKVTSDVIHLSGDYKGATVTTVLCLLPICSESLWQQHPASDFIKTLRENGGSSAYVPTTSIMSSTDELVLQLGGEAASGYVEDERNVGVSNVWIQEACALQPGGGVYDHVGILFSNLAYDLTVDALTHDGPGKVERLDLKKTCSVVSTPGLSVLQVLQSQLALVAAFFNIFSYPAVIEEPPIRDYAK